MGLRVGFERRVENPLLDHLVDVQRRGQGVEHLGAALHTTLGRFLPFLQQILEAAMVGLEEDDRDRFRPGPTATGG